MRQAFHAAALEKGLGFFTLDPATLAVTWDEDTARVLGTDVGGKRLAASLRSGLRAYLPAALAAGSSERLRCIVPVGESAVELVVLPPDPGTPVREGFFFPHPLHLPLETMRRYVLANVSNKLRSLLNSVIIASDVVAAADRETMAQHHRFLSLMAEDAREVNTLLTRMEEAAAAGILPALAPAGKVEPGPVLEAVHGSVLHLAEDASIAFTLAVPSSLPAVRGDEVTATLAVFLAVQHALTRTEPLGEIVLTARELQGVLVEVCFAPGEVPAGLAAAPESHGLEPAVLRAWSEGAELQLIDSLLGLRGGGLSLLRSAGGAQLLRLRFSRA